MTLAPDAGWSLGRYELVRRLATGGMAEIYLARVAGLAGFEKQVVVKRMLPHLARDPAYVDMFLAEARIAALLDHPNLVRVDDIGEDGDNYFYVMEYVRGVDLLELMQALDAQGRAVPVEAAAAIALGLCAGLSYAHTRRDRGVPLRLVHRDVSLSNVLVSYDGAVKLCDFGVAKVDDPTRRTRTGVLKGKLGYMSPEQCTGAAVDHRSDLFSLGITLYELTTGERLFGGGGTDFEVMQRIVRCEVVPPSQLRFDYPAQLEAIVLKALARDPNERYQSARAIHHDLEAFVRAERLAAASSAVAELVTAAFPVTTRRPTSIGIGELLTRPDDALPIDELPTTIDRRQRASAAALPAAPAPPPVALPVVLPLRPPALTPLATPTSLVSLPEPLAAPRRPAARSQHDGARRPASRRRARAWLTLGALGLAAVIAATSLSAHYAPPPPPMAAAPIASDAIGALRAYYQISLNSTRRFFERAVFSLLPLRPVGSTTGTLSP